MNSINLQLSIPFFQIKVEEAEVHNTILTHLWNHSSVQTILMDDSLLPEKQQLAGLLAQKYNIEIMISNQCAVILSKHLMSTPKVEENEELEAVSKRIFKCDDESSKAISAQRVSEIPF